MKNLLAETIEAIEESGHTPEDVTFIGSADAAYRCTWEEFTRIADVEYDNGFGSSSVPTDLIIRFADGRSMWRGEYDGSEWWEFDRFGEVDYTQPGKAITNLTGGGWSSVAELNGTDSSNSVA